jgi:hypothetical protein
MAASPGKITYPAKMNESHNNEEKWNKPGANEPGNDRMDIHTHPS